MILERPLYVLLIIQGCIRNFCHSRCHAPGQAWMALAALHIAPFLARPCSAKQIFVISIKGSYDLVFVEACKRCNDVKCFTHHRGYQSCQLIAEWLSVFVAAPSPVVPRCPPDNGLDPLRECKVCRQC